MRRFLLMSMVFLSLPVLSQRAYALATEEIGNAPLNEQNYQDWQGILPVINDRSRVYTIWVNGNENFYYSGSTNELNKALVHFSKIKADTHIVVLRAGKAQQKTLQTKTPIDFNWRLHIIGGLAKAGVKVDDEFEWHKDPVLTIQVDEKIDLDKLKIPAGISLKTTKNQATDSESTAIQRAALERFVERHKAQ